MENEEKKQYTADFFDKNKLKVVTFFSGQELIFTLDDYRAAKEDLKNGDFFSLGGKEYAKYGVYFFSDARLADAVDFYMPPQFKKRLELVLKSYVEKMHLPANDEALMAMALAVMNESTPSKNIPSEK